MLRAALFAPMIFSAVPTAGQEVAIPTPGGVVLRALVVPAAAGAAPRPPVVALHGCAGLGAFPQLPAREGDWARRLSALGHTVVFPDSFGSRGIPEVCRRGDAGARPEVERRADALATAAWAAAQHFAPAGQGAFVLGWSHGGSTALAAAQGPGAAETLRAAVALYPGCVRVGQAPPPWAPVVPVLMLLGESDEWTSARACRRLAERGGADVEVVAYPGTHHGFDQPALPLTELSGLAQTTRGGGVARIGTEPAARADALERVPAFLARHGGPAR